MMVKLTERERLMIRLMCDETLKSEGYSPSYVGLCSIGGSSMFLLGTLGHGGFRRNWKTETRLAKADLAKSYAKNYALLWVEALGK